MTYLERGFSGLGFPNYGTVSQYMLQSEWLELALNVEECNLVRLANPDRLVYKHELDLSDVPPLRTTTVAPTIIVAPTTTVEEEHRKVLPLDILKDLRVSLSEQLWEVMGFNKKYTRDAALCLALGIESKDIMESGTSHDKALMYNNIARAEELEQLPFYVIRSKLDMLAKEDPYNAWIDAKVPPDPNKCMVGKEKGIAHMRGYGVPLEYQPKIDIMRAKLDRSKITLQVLPADGGGCLAALIAYISQMPPLRANTVNDTKTWNDVMRATVKAYLDALGMKVIELDSEWEADRKKIIEGFGKGADIGAPHLDAWLHGAELFGSQ
jgi:hypothetical protein